MPNVQIHVPVTERSKTEIIKMRKRIFELTENLPFAGDIVVSVCNTTTVDRGAKSCPFLKIFSDKTPQIEKIMEVLDPMDIDMEGVKVFKFQEKRSTRE